MRLRLSSRLILSVVIIEALLLGVLVWNSVRLISSSHAEILERYTREQSLLLANSIAPGLAVHDRAIVQDSLSLLEDNAITRYVQVLTHDGLTLASMGQLPETFAIDKGYEEARQDGVFDLQREVSLYGESLGSIRVGYSIDFIRELTTETRLQNTVIALAGLTISIFATILLGLFLTRNLRKLEIAAYAVAEDKLDYRIPIEGNDEISDVARSFNAMTQRLDESRQSLESKNDQLFRQAQHFQALLDGIDAIIMEADPQEKTFLYVSQEGEDMLGYPLDQWLQKGFWFSLVHPEDIHGVKTWEHPRTTGSYQSDYRMRHRDGHYLWVRDISTVDEGNGICRGLLVDITEQKTSEEQLLFLADHDPLTERYNRRRFQDELNNSIARAKRYAHQGALMFIDLDQFKYINDTLGHAVGDAYLKDVSATLGESLREADILGRLGGDEFGIILPVANEQDAKCVGQMILDRLAKLPVRQSGQSIQVTASIGIVLFPDQGDTPGELLSRADAAMYSAKDAGRNCCHLFSHDDRELRAMHTRMEWEGKIRHALEHDGFVLHYQPVFNLATQRVSHYEVLLRMKADDGSLYCPGAFLETAERFGLIRDIDYWVVRKSMEVQAQSNADKNPVSLAINLSGRHFNELQLKNHIVEDLALTGADPTRLIFEITETAALNSIQDAAKFVRRLHSAGCRVALDDFGVGYSSFHYLKHLPVDMVKIDGSFVRNLDTDQFDRIFVRAMSEVAQGLGITTIGEFVENGRVVTVMRSLGIEHGQGFYLAKPQAEFLPADYSYVDDGQLPSVESTRRH